METATKKTTARKTATKKTATAKAKPTAKTTPKKPEAPKVPGVRAGRTRTYLAGLIIARHGIAAGVTDAMVAELDEEYGNANPRESQWCLKNAWHVARGYAGIAEDATE